MANKGSMFSEIEEFLLKGKYPEALKGQPGQRQILNAMERMKKIFSENLKKSESETGASVEEEYEGKVPIHPLTGKPVKAWQRLSVKQTVNCVEPMDSSTPITDDNLRFVCISDTHCQIEKLDISFVPDGDVLLHAGDFTQIGTPKAIHKFNEYLGSLPHKVKVVIAGNHDLSLDEDMVNTQRQFLDQYFNLKVHVFEDILQEMGVKQSRDLLTNCIYLLDSTIDICGVKVHGSPWQPWFYDWGFNLKRGSECLKKWDLIPDDTDILMTHGPPIGHWDSCFDGNRAGCVELLTTIQSRIKPAYHVFGHIHEAYGITSDGQTTFINASTCSLRYKPHNKPIVFDFPIPDGHRKEELLNLPRNNLTSDNDDE